MRLPRPLYESLPWLYFAGGVLALIGSYKLHNGFSAMALMVAGVIGLIGGAAVWLRRRDFRTTHAQYWGRSGNDDHDDTLR